MTAMLHAYTCTRVVGAGHGAAQRGPGRSAGLCDPLIGFHHWANHPRSFEGGSPLGYLFMNEWVGVPLFFGPSGLLLGGQLMEHGRSRGAPVTFYKQRAARILPVYLLLLR